MMIEGLLVFIVPTIIVSLWALFFPVIRELKKRRPKAFPAAHPILYCIIMSIVIGVTAPIFFIILMFGDCANFRYNMLKKMLEIYQN